MAALESLNFDVESAIHYIHCALSNVPLALAVAEVAPMVVPRPESDNVKQLGSVGCRVVPHRLHMFKEPLDTKFGFVTFFIHESAQTASEEEVHRLTLKWIHEDLKAQLASVSVNVALAQPPECYSSVPFLQAMHEQCSFLNANKVKDAKKMETFLLSKIRFSDEGLNSYKNNRFNSENSEGEKMKDEGWKVVGTLRISSLTSKELLWLGREHGGLPSILVTNGNIATATCDKEALHTFLEEALVPLIKVIA